MWHLCFVSTAELYAKTPIINDYFKRYSDYNMSHYWGGKGFFFKCNVYWKKSEIDKDFHWALCQASMLLYIWRRWFVGQGIAVAWRFLISKWHVGKDFISINKTAAPLIRILHLAINCSLPLISWILIWEWMCSEFRQCEASGKSSLNVAVKSSLLPLFTVLMSFVQSWFNSL